MNLITPLCTMLLTIGFCPRAAHAQDSPIIINDNGGVPLDTAGRSGKAKAKKGSKGATTRTWSEHETHIHHARGIKHVAGEFFIERANYRAVCFVTPNEEIDLADDGAAWALTTLSGQGNTVIGSPGGKNKSHIHIDPSPRMAHRPPDYKDMDDPENQLTAVRFKERNHRFPFTIHYCGPATRCLGGEDGKTDQCPKAKDIKQE